MNQILESLLLRYQAQKVEAVTNLNIYLTNPCGVAEHPNVVYLQKQKQKQKNLKRWRRR